MLSLPDVHTHTQYGNAFALHNYRIGIGPLKPEGYFSAGIHPWDAGAAKPEEQLKTLAEIIRDPRCIALGETGLDTLQGDKIIQRDLLKVHLDYAQQSNKPCILHLVRDTETWHAIRRPYGNTIRCIVHGFRGNAALAIQHINNGDLLSFGAALLKDSRLQTIVQNLPANTFLFETDTADPALLPDIYTLAAKLRNMSFPELQNEILCTFKREFKIEWN